MAFRAKPPPVERLIAKLDELSERINLLSNKTINVATSADTSSIATPSPIELGAEGYDYATEAATIKEINKLKNESITLDAKIAATQDEVYQKVLQTKDLYKQSVKEQKEVAAQQRLTENAYENTMRGMKQQLADIKQVMQGVDLGDTEQMANLTKQADELNSKLLEIEKSYGQFGRQVGHYEIVAEGFKGLAIQVGDTTQQFDNAKQAMKELQKEMQTLSTKKDMGLISPEEEERLKNLIPVVAQLRSSIQDAGKPMDKIMDTMQSIVAITQAGKGIAAFFGFDSDEIERSIQKLVALQNAMQGLETIQKQLQTQEGIGGWIAKGNEAIDKLVAKITGANKAQQALNTTNTAGATTSNALAAAETAQATATNTATVATKGLSLALKSIGIGLVISAVAMLITYWKDIYNWFTDTIPALKNLSTWFDKLKAAVLGIGNVLVNYIVQPFLTIGKVIKAVVTGNLKDIPDIITSGLKKTFNVVENFQKGYNKETERQQEAHNEKMRQQQKKANEEAEKDAEAKYGQDLKRTKDYYKKQLALTKEGTEEHKELQRKLWEVERRERETNNKKGLAVAKKNAQDEAKVDEELIQVRIANMKEGLNKTIKQLEEERKQRLSKLNSNARNYKELEAEINRYYDKKIEDAVNEHTKKVEKMHNDMWANILHRQIENAQDSLNQFNKDAERIQKETDKLKDQLYNQGISSYGIQGKRQYSPETQEKLGILSTSKSEMVSDVKTLIDLQRDYATASAKFASEQMKLNDDVRRSRENFLKNEVELFEKLEELEEFREGLSDEEYNKKKENIEKELELERAKYSQVLTSRDKEFNNLQEDFNRTQKAYDKHKEYIDEHYSSIEERLQVDNVRKTLVNEAYTESLSKMFKQRTAAVNTYWRARLNDEKEAAEKSYKQELELLELKNKEAKQKEIDSWSAEFQAQSDWYVKKEELIRAEAKKEKWTEEELNANLENIEKKYNKAAEQLLALHNEKLKAIDKDYEQSKYALEEEKNKRVKKINAEAYQESLQDFRDFQTALSNLESKQPVMNIWGIVNLKETNKNNKELLSSYEELATQLKEKRESLNKDYNDGDGIIDEQIYKSSLRELDVFAADLGDKMDKVKGELSFGGQWEMLSEGINQWVQMVGQAANQIMSSLSEITSNQYEALINEQEKYIEKLETMYDKQKEITQKYADDVNSIEDELKTARGDRRQQLIDNLNAEMAAQRASLAQEKKIEKEQEKAEEKKKKLEHDQAVAKKKMDLAQAVINMAMAISMAAVNKWPIPAIPMMALAAAATAAQIAAIKSQPIPSYGTGGMIEGKSHKEGGVKALVGNSPLELEGQEYVIRKKSTVSNVQVLDFINRSERKLNLDDFIDFYSSGKVKKHILSASPKARYADGGQVIPTLRTDIEINDRLVQSMEDYANRPYYVTVTEIEDAQANVRNVRVLSGLEE